jgi:hypothetical protein
MKKICFWAMIAMAGLSFSFGASTGKYVAVLETATEDTTVLSRSELQHLTDKLRSEAVKELPAEQGFTIMTRENIEAMLPPSKGLAECEGSCLVETGKNISADYVAQGRAGRFGKKLTLTVELYETAGAKLLGSMSVESPDADGLLDAIEKNSAGLFQKVPDTGAIPIAGNSAGGIMSISEQYITKISTEPVGAVLSIDGLPLSGCQQTPCKVELPAGNHRIMAILEGYDSKDTTISVSKNGDSILLPLVANYGILLLSPQMNADFGKVSELELSVDGKSVLAGAIRLSPGRHQIRLRHRCYEDRALEVSIMQGDTTSFTDSLTARTGGLVLSTVQNGAPVSVPVYINGVAVGVTPWSGLLPICSHVEAGEKKNLVDVMLQSGKTVHYTQELASAMQPGLFSAEIPSVPASAIPRAENPGRSMSIAHKLAVVLGGASLAGLGTGLWFNYKAGDSHDDYEDAVDAKDYSRASSAYDDLQNFKKYRNISYGVAAGALAVGILLWVIGD